MEQGIRNIILKRYVVKNPNDIILQGVPQSVIDTCYKYKLLQQRIGEAWDVAPSFYQWTRNEFGLDAINHITKQAAEIKNSSCTDNSSSRRRNYDKLLEFKEAHEEYELLYCIINDKTDKDVMKYDGRIRYVSGMYALRELFGENAIHVVDVMKRAAQEFLQNSNLADTICE